MLLMLLGKGCTFLVIQNGLNCNYVALFIILETHVHVGRFWVLRKVKLCVVPLGANAK